METKVNYTIVGLFVILLGAILIAAGFWIAWHGNVKSYKTYAVYMEEAVSGLEIQAPVKFNGVDVGYVKDMSLDPTNPQKVRLLLDIAESTPISDTTVATLMAQGITGITYIGLKNLTPNGKALQIKPGQPYPVIKWTPSILVQLDTTLRDLTASFKSISNGFDQLLTEQNQQSIRDSLSSIATFTGALAASSHDIQQVLENSSKASDKLPAIMQQLQTTLSSAQVAANSLNTATNQATSTLRDSKVLVQSLAQQTVPQTTEAITKLTVLLDQLQKITAQMQNNPSVLVRGTKPKPLGPGEN